jgi:hypothetical protein
MDYRKEIRELLRVPFITVCGSSLSLKLLKIYSDLYECGREVRACENSQRKYYELLKKEGIMKVIELEKIQKRTCIPNWVGNVYSHAIGEHLNNEHITDEKAISLLEKGLIPESFFKKLPDGYKKPILGEKPASIVGVEKRGRKPKN